VGKKGQMKIQEMVGNKRWGKCWVFRGGGQGDISAEQKLGWWDGSGTGAPDLACRGSSLIGAWPVIRGTKRGTKPQQGVTSLKA